MRRYQYTPETYENKRNAAPLLSPPTAAGRASAQFLRYKEFGALNKAIYL
jgi:hypothetical protein